MLDVRCMDVAMYAAINTAYMLHICCMYVAMCAACFYGTDEVCNDKQPMYGGDAAAMASPWRPLAGPRRFFSAAEPPWRQNVDFLH